MKEAQVYIWEYSKNPRITLEVYDKVRTNGKLGLRVKKILTYKEADKYLKKLKKIRTIYINTHLDNSFSEGPIGKKLDKKYHSY